MPGSDTSHREAVAQRRGGTCYELIHRVRQGPGFRPRKAMGRRTDVVTAAGAGLMRGVQ